MKKMVIGRVAVQVLLSVLLSIFVSQLAWRLTVPTCVLTTGCSDHADTSAFPGTVIIQERGFPIAYRAVTTFEPGSQVRSITAGPVRLRMFASRNTVITVLIDGVFWYALLEVLAGGLLPVLRKKFARFKP